VGVAIPIPRPPAAAKTEERLRRLRALAWLLDRSIPIGGGWRIGLDPILGLLPGLGDWIGALLSFYFLYEGGRLGLPTSVLARMGGNILVEALIGVVPLAGDLFDFAWQANVRNLALIERHYRPALKPRSLRNLWFALAAMCFALLAMIAGLALLTAKIISMLFR
jgi:hypothetical protein